MWKGRLSMVNIGIASATAVGCVGRHLQVGWETSGKQLGKHLGTFFGKQLRNILGNSWEKSQMYKTYLWKHIWRHIRWNTSGKMSVETHLETYLWKHTCVAQKVFKYCQNVFAFRFIYNLHVIGILMLPHLVRSGGHCYPPTRIPQDQSCSSVTLRGPPLYFEDQDKRHRIYDMGHMAAT